MIIKVLGMGCKKCQTLEERINILVKDNNFDAEIEHVTDMQEIMKYHIMMTPGLVINGIVKSAGTIPKDEQLLQWLREN